VSNSAFVTAFAAAVADGSFVRLVLAAPTEPGLEKVRARRVALAKGDVLQLVSRFGDRDRTRNVAIADAPDEVARQLDQFGGAHLYTTKEVVHLDRKSGRLRRGPPEHEAPPPTAHDHVKQRPVALDPRWLEALGLARTDGKPIRGMEDKLRQVVRFTEILDHWLPRSDVEGARFRAVDVGSGKGWLTFATWQVLRARGFAADVTGIELRPALAAKTEAVARSLGCDGLSFRAGAVAAADLTGAELVIALHACDTATDDALALGVEAAAGWMLVAPCCHREVRPQMAPPAVLHDVLRHGILRTREAEIATDALRASLLETAGYEARVFEFVTTEHTDKNLVIAAHRRGPPDPEAEVRTRALAGFYGITHQRLADRLGVRLDGS
jgi:hypothetical protein